MRDESRVGGDLAPASGAEQDEFRLSETRDPKPSLGDGPRASERFKSRTRQVRRARMNFESDIIYSYDTRVGSGIPTRAAELRVCDTSPPTSEMRLCTLTRYSQRSVGPAPVLLVLRTRTPPPPPRSSNCWSPALFDDADRDWVVPGWVEVLQMAGASAACSAASAASARASHESCLK
jgi:hypothetical protein